MSLILTALIVVLGAGAAYVWRRPSIMLARALTVGTLGVALALATHVLASDVAATRATLLFNDDLSALCLPVTALGACAVLLASPMRELTGRTLASVLLSLAAAVAALCAADLAIFTLAWLLGLGAIYIALPSDDAHARIRKGYVAYAGLGTAPLLLALAILTHAHDTSFVASPEVTNALSTSTQHLVFFLLALTAAFRSGLVPLHAWLPTLTSRAPVAVAALVFGAQLGPVLVARAMVPLTPLVAQSDLSPFSTWAVVSALYAALLGLVQRDVKRTLGYVLTSQSALLLFGMSGTDPESMHGALLGCIGLGLTATGLLLIAGALEARMGSADVVRLEGRGRTLPRMAALFFLLAAAAIGLPGTLPFVSEDLLLHGLLRTNPRGALVLLLGTVLNGITLLRLFFAVFQGPSRERESQKHDLTPREGMVIAGLLALTVLAGLSPRVLLALQEHSVAALSAIEHPRPSRPE